MIIWISSKMLRLCFLSLPAIRYAQLQSHTKMSPFQLQSADAVNYNLVDETLSFSVFFADKSVLTTLWKVSHIQFFERCLHSKPVDVVDQPPFSKLPTHQPILHINKTSPNLAIRLPHQPTFSHTRHPSTVQWQPPISHISHQSHTLAPISHLPISLTSHPSSHLPQYPPISHISSTSSTLAKDIPSQPPISHTSHSTSYTSHPISHTTHQSPNLANHLSPNHPTSHTSHSSPALATHLLHQPLISYTSHSFPTLATHLLHWPLISYTSHSSPTLATHLLHWPLISYTSHSSPTLATHLLHQPLISYTSHSSPTLATHLLHQPCTHLLHQSLIPYTSHSSPTLVTHLLHQPLISYTGHPSPTLATHLLHQPPISHTSHSSPTLATHLQWKILCILLAACYDGREMADVSGVLLGEERDKPPEFAFSLVSYLPPARSAVQINHRAGHRSVLATGLRIRIRRIRMFLGLLEPDQYPFVRGSDPDPSIIKQKQ